MKEVFVEGFQNPEKEVMEKVQNYFRSHGFTKECPTDSLEGGAKFTLDIQGTIDDFEVSVTYNDYKPTKVVIREIMALDTRISNVRAERYLSAAHYKEQLGNIEFEPIFVMVDGKLMQTTLYDWIIYGTRNIDYTRR